MRIKFWYYRLSNTHEKQLHLVDSLHFLDFLAHYICSIQLYVIRTSQRHYDVTLLMSLLSYMIIVMFLLIY